MCPKTAKCSCSNIVLVYSVQVVEFFVRSGLASFDDVGGFRNPSLFRLAHMSMITKLPNGRVPSNVLAAFGLVS